MKALALSWSEHRRMQELCAGLGLELVVLQTRRRGALRYLVLSAATIGLLLRRRVKVLLIQNPSLILGVLTALLRRLFGFQLIVDAHNEAVDPYINRQGWIRWLAYWVIRHSELTIVTNRQLAQIIETEGGRAFVLPDRVPAAPPAASAPALAGAFNVVLIATYSRDEPIAAVFEAVRGSDVHLYVTGNPKKLDPLVAARTPPNVHFTGFLEEEAYWALLRAADGIIDLTLMPDCLVCGAYEALAIGKPMLLSGNTASVELFGDAAAFTDNSTADIRRALEALRLRRAELSAAAVVKRGEMAQRWDAAARSLARFVAEGPVPEVATGA
jgi:glycosyltransferase involved in cell wall biosynthesis